MDATLLLEHREFVLQVARALLRNEADAEDAVQDTYVAALQSAPPRTGRVRPWLGGIVRNVARNRKRRELRRVSREAKVARPDRAGGASDSAERLAWQQRVVEAVLALDPIYRDVLVLRFYEDLPPRDVAARLDIPVNTVRTRTRRAIEQLRSVFDSKYGGRKAWSAPLAGLVLAQSAASAGVPKLLVAAVLLAVTGATGALLHSTTRRETAPTRHDGASTTAKNDVSGRPSEAGETNRASARAASDRPTHFHGLLFEHAGTPPLPLTGATVQLTPPLWIATMPPLVLATAVTDGEGRFAFAWKPQWGLPPLGDRLGYLLFVTRAKSWSDPMYATRAGFGEGDGLRARVELIESPRFQFVRGPSRAPIAGARVSLFVPPSPAGRMELGSKLGSAITDTEGCARPQWPSWAESAIIRVERPGGDMLQWRLPLQHVRSYDPYDVALDEENIATVRLQILDRSGEAAGSGVRVLAWGSWAPDGLSEGPHFRVAHGAEPVPLIGATDDLGVAIFRFPADRARQGIYLPQRIMAFQMRDGRPRFIVWRTDPRGLPEEEGARAGSTLPILQFGVTPFARPIFIVRDDDPRTEVAVYWRGADGRVRKLKSGRQLRVAGYSLYELLNGGPGPSRDRGELAVITRRNGRIGWTKFDEAAFARCLRREAVVEPGMLRETHAVTLRVPEGMERTVVRLESVEVPYVGADSIGGGVTATIELPDVPGKWRVRLGEKIVEGVFVDPRERTEYVLDPK